MREKKPGKLRCGRPVKKETSRKQAIAIGLSEARQEGMKASSPRKGTTPSKKTVVEETRE